MTDMPTADVATADMPTADAQNSGHSRHRGTATTTNAHGGAAEPHARTQAPGTKETPARRHQARKQHPERSTDYNHQTD